VTSDGSTTGHAKVTGEDLVVQSPSADREPDARPEKGTIPMAVSSSYGAWLKDAARNTHMVHVN